MLFIEGACYIIIITIILLLYYCNHIYIIYTGFTFYIFKLIFQEITSTVNLARFKTFSSGNEILVIGKNF